MTSLFSFLREVYHLDTLDTRFTSDTKTPYKDVIDRRADPAVIESIRDGPPHGVPIKTDGRGCPIAQPSKWFTTEFYFYYFVFITVVPYMFWIVYDVSRPSDKNYYKYEHLLSEGWVPGHNIDISDAQYRTLRNNLPYLAALTIFHPILRKVYEFIRPISTGQIRPSTRANGGTSTYTSFADAEARQEQRASFDFGFAMLFMVALHGFSIFKIMLILYLNYSIATKLPRKYVPAATWTFNIVTLFANELCEGYYYQSIAAALTPWATAAEGVRVNNWGTWLDQYKGIMPRWQISFNITVLRLISFNLDYYWSLDRRAQSPTEKKQLDPANLSERDRVSIPPAAKDFSFRNFVAYTLYAPLYLAGPILTFNDYISQLKYPPASIEIARTIKYGVRFLFCLLAMELLLHFDYCVAISKGNPDWNDYTPAQLSLLSYFNLHVLWLKLLLPWRLFRLWALIDGIDPPENMIRCLSDNPSTVAFWRGWHRSYNRWLQRYLYIPIGGSRSSGGRFGVAKVVFNYALVFTFVALWHDISLNLLVWGWLVVLFMMPEVLAGYIFPRKRWENHLTAYRCLCGVGVVGNLLMMMMCNLVGFAVGVDGLKSIIAGIFRDYSGLAFLVTASCVLFVGIQVQFEVRESEMRQGLFLKC